MIRAATEWSSNADMIVACRDLGYLSDADAILDPTYGQGTWWQQWRPDGLETLNRNKDGSDFARLPYLSEWFDATCYDPPYVCTGGRKTSTIPKFNAGYGLTDTPTSPQELQWLLNRGLNEVSRITKIGGFVLAKCQNYVSSGRLHPGVYHTWAQAQTIGLVLHDELIHLSGTGPQPQHPRQVHARRNNSVLLVFRKTCPHWLTDHRNRQVLAGEG